MPIHDWTRVDAGIFHDFHQAWTIEVRDVLNAGRLPPGFCATAEQVAGGPIPDVSAPQRRAAPGESEKVPGTLYQAGTLGQAVPRTAPVPRKVPDTFSNPGADAPNQARFVTSTESDLYARKAIRIAIKHRLGRVAAVIEIVSPGDKSSRHGLRSFVEKAAELLLQGINLLVVDLFPPSPRDPQGIHKAIWDAIRDEPFELPPDKPLTVAAYSAGVPQTAYVEPVAVGDPLPEPPIFLDAETCVPAPLETTYQATWARWPDVLRERVESPERAVPWRFPSEADRIYKEAQEFRRLSPTQRLLAIADLIASGEALMATSPRREAAQQLRQAQEDEWQRIQKELFARHGA